MKKSLILSLLICLLLMFAPNSFAQTFPGNPVLDEQSINRTDDQITEAQFNQIIDGVADKFRPSIESHGAKLIVQKLWSDSEMNAKAFRYEEKKEWGVKFSGGVAKHKLTTLDSFTYIVCHEFGHHLGGYAFVHNYAWGSAEGQSDYFASQTCIREMWKDQIAENAKFRVNVNPYVKAKCDQAWQMEADQDLCYRIAATAYQLAIQYASIMNEPNPKFETPDPTISPRTLGAHPPVQCRLDNTWNAALCTKDFDLMVIPGDDQPSGKRNSPEAERASTRYTCFEAYGDTLGNRAKCWFKAQTAQ